MVNKGKIVNSIFPPIEQNDSYILELLKAEREKVSMGAEVLLVSTKELQNVIINGKTKLQLKCYVNNLDTIFIELSISCKDGAHIIRLANHKFKNGYNNIILDIFRFNETEKWNLNNEDLISLDKIRIYSKVKNNQTLDVGELKIYNLLRIEGKNESQLIKKIINRYPVIASNNNHQGLTEARNKKKLFFNDEDIEFLKYPIDYEIQFSNKDDNHDINELEGVKANSVKVEIRKILIEYFNNTENKRLNLLVEYDSIARAYNNLEDFYSSLSTFLIKLNDTHFRLINDKYNIKTNINLPIYFYRISDKPEVVAVCDTSLIDKVNLGDKLIEVNGTKIKNLVLDIAETTTGTTYHSREAKIYQKLLLYLIEYFKTDSLILKMESFANTNYYIKISSEDVLKNKRISIPFEIKDKQKTFDYKVIDDYSYLKIGAFDNVELRPFFYSKIDSLFKTKGVIIDLRNNPGGDLSNAFLLSFFIQKPEILFTDSKNEHDYETYLVNPDPYYYFSKPIIILIDARTTCSAEFFISAMLKSRKDVITIGTSRTSGSAQHSKYLKLPETKTFKAKLMYRTNIELNAFGINTDNSNGIDPMILTYFNSYIDLAPYNDKILRIGLNYLKELNK